MIASHLLRAARESSGLTQVAVARRASTSQPAVARYEAGTVSPSVDTLERLLRACGQRLELRSAPANASDLSGTLGRLVRRRRGEIARVARVHGATQIRVFGSVARGTEAPGSDIDLLVESAPDRSLVDIGVLARELTVMPGVDVDVATTDLLRDDVREMVLQEAVPL